MKVPKLAWRRLVQAWDLVPIRLPGIVLLVGALLVALRFSRDEADYLLYPAGLAAAGLVVLCSLSVAVAALVLGRAVRRSPAGVPETFETTQPTRTTFRCPRLGRWPIVEVRVDWAAPAGVTVELDPHGRELEEVVIARERGRHTRIVRRITVEDVFGLARVRFRVGWDQPLCIMPASAAAAAELAASYARGDSFSSPSGAIEGDLVEMRRYGPGDPLRHVLWKTFARTRRLLVRMPERAIAPQPITVAFLIAGAGDEPSAAAARLYLERGLLGPEFTFAADGATRTTSDTREALDQIVDSAAARGYDGQALEMLAGRVEESRLSSCIVFAPPVDGPWRARVAAFSRRLPAPATVVIGVEGVAAPRRGRLARLLVVGNGARGAHDEVGTLRAALEADGLRVQVLHRQSGQILGEYDR